MVLLSDNRIIRSLAAAAAALLLLAGCGGAAPPAAPAMKLSLGLGSPPTALPNSVLWLAKDGGFYDKEGLDVIVTEVSGSPQVVAGLLAKQFDVVNFNPQDVLSLVASKKVDLRAIHSAGDINFFLMISRTAIGSPADLAGKTFGVASTGSFDDLLSRQVLTASGVNPSSVIFLGVGAPDVRTKALIAGRTDATTVSLATWLSVQSEQGIKVLVNPRDFKRATPFVSSVSAVTTDVLRDRPDALRRFTAAILKASRFYAGNRDAWVAAAQKRNPNAKAADLAALWDQYAAAWAVNGQMNLAAYQQTADFLYANNAEFKQLPRVPVEAWTDTGILDAVLKQIGVDSTSDNPGRSIQ